MRNRRTITSEFDIVTPMFLGDAERHATRIRETSLKGALAFWWRAKRFAGFVADAGGEQEQNDALKKLQEREQVLFGGPNGTGRFLLKVSAGPTNGIYVSSDVGEGARYLGYGVLNAEPPRTHFAAGAKFHVQLLINPLASDGDADEDDVPEIVGALKLFGLLGGLGSRVRRGWGSVALQQMTFDGIPKDTWTAPTTVEAYGGELKKAIGRTPRQVGADFNLSAFSLESRIAIWNGQSFDNPLSALDVLGKGFRRYRAWRGDDVDKSFKDDHDWFKQDERFTDGNSYVPKRTAFGLPHNYKKKFGVTGAGAVDRRASPLLFHIHKVGKNCIPVATFLPTKFQKSDEVFIGDATQDKSPIHNKRYVFDISDQRIITDYLDGITHSDGDARTEAVTPYFPSTSLLP